MGQSFYMDCVYTDLDGHKFRTAVTIQIKKESDRDNVGIAIAHCLTNTAPVPMLCLADAVHELDAFDPDRACNDRAVGEAEAAFINAAKLYRTACNRSNVQLDNDELREMKKGTHRW